MNPRRSIVAFDYAVTEVLCQLDALLTPMGCEWKPIGITGGFSMEIKHQSTATPSNDDLAVLILPVAWPGGSYIRLRMYRSAEELWTPEEGMFYAPHIPIFASCDVDFDFSTLPFALSTHDTTAAVLLEGAFQHARGIYWKGKL